MRGGQSYTIDIRMFSVETGAITKSVNRTYRGEIDGLIMEIERIAWHIVDLSPPPAAAARPGPEKKEEEKPKKKRGLGRLLLGTVILAAAGGGAYYYLYVLPEEPLPMPPSPPQ